MFIALLRFELVYHLRQRVFWLFALMFFLLGLAFTNLTFGYNEVPLHAPYTLTQIFSFLSLIAVFPVSLLSTKALLRDKSSRMDQLIYPSGIEKLPFLLSRFSGLWFSSLLIFSFAPGGYFLGSFMPWVEAHRSGVVDLQAYVWVGSVIIVPNLFFLSALLFASTVFSRNHLATCLTGILAYVLYWVCAIYANSPLLAQSHEVSAQEMAWAALLDPYGISAYLEQSQFWTLAMRKTEALQLEGFFLWNRLAWMGTSLLILLSAFAGFSFKPFREKTKKKKNTKQSPLQKKAYATVPTDPDSLSYRFKTFRALCRLEIRQLFRSLPFLGIFILWLIIVTVEIFPRMNGGFEYGTSPYPLTFFLTALIADPLPKLALLMLLIYSGEMVWREQSVRMHELTGSTPLGNLSFFLSKLSALALLPVLLISSGVLIAISFQLSKGFYSIDLNQYLGLYLLLGIPLILYGVLMLFVQVIAPNKYTGLGVNVLLLLIFQSSLGIVAGLEHPLLRFAFFPSARYTPMTGYGNSVEAFPWFTLYWMSLTLLLIYGCYELWQRGKAEKLLKRIAKIKTGRKASSYQVIFLTLCLLIGTGTASFIFYNTNVLNTYESGEEALDFREAYERTYSSYKEQPQPQVSVSKNQVGLFPGQKKIWIKGDYTLTNYRQEPIQKIWLTFRREAKVGQLFLEDARLTRHNEAFNVYWFELDQSLLAGDSVRLQFELEVHHQGFVHDQPDRSIVTNGSFLMDHQLFPVIGYRYSYEIQEENERRKRGLPVSASAGEDDGHGNHFVKESQRMWFETVISTSGDQIAVAPGDLISKWQEKGRNYFHYKTDRPVNPFIAYFSGRYEVRKKQYKGISLEVYYHPQDSFNINRILTAMELSLDYCSRQFGPYPFRHLRIVEIPAHWESGGLALPGTIALVENRGFLTDLSSPDAPDLVTKRVAHEVGHQWWGHQVTPSYQPGASLIVESLAKYTETEVLRSLYHRGYANYFLAKEMRHYFMGRGSDQEEEQPLQTLQMNQSYLYYRKGNIVMNALHDLLGEKRMNAALKQLVQKHAWPARRPTAQDLIREIRARADSSEIPLIDEWMKQIVTYDLGLQDIETEVLPDGKYKVSFKIVAAKWKTQEKGEEVRRPFRENISIGLYDNDPGDIQTEAVPVYSKNISIQNDTSRMEIITGEQPQWLVLDPDLHYLDKNRQDNSKALSW